MRVFASDTIKGLMGRFGIPEDEPIENRIITKSLENAQTKIEGFHFDARKHVLQFDNVINHQRQTMYARRRKLLLGEPADVKEYLDGILNEVDAENEEEAKKLRAAIAEKIAALGETQFLEIVRRLALQTNDMFWVDHLELMDYARESVRLRAVGQRDPLVEYKREALRLYKDMEAGIKRQIIDLLPRIDVGVFLQSETEMKRMEKQMELAGGSAGSSDAKTSVPASVSKNEHIGRNDPCWCGSGKKYKKCHGAVK
jgi:preprotein translocase subunit SecA